MNKFQETFDLGVPLIQGPMGGVAGPDLVAAVTNAGALGVLPIWADSIEGALEQVRETQARTSGHFAVNLRADLNQKEHIAMAADLGVEVFHMFWGDPSASASDVLSRGGKLIATVADAESARTAIGSGACALVAQGVEAGGHVLSDFPLSQLLEDVLPIAGEIPVIAAGGISDTQVAQMRLDQGASGILCGSRYVASKESQAHQDYKAAIVRAGANSTVRSTCFDVGWPDAPHRTLRNSTYQMWEDAGFPEMGNRPGEGDTVLISEEGHELPRYLVVPPREGMQGDILAAATYAGAGVSAIDSIETAQQIVENFAATLHWQ